tara:strand:- start:4605 stop:4943 length:339 start_codon:yes stop_codon:yes gene_type:complete
MSEQQIVDNPHLNELLDERMVRQLRELPFTGEKDTDRDEDWRHYQEVSFKLKSGINMQCAVLYHKWIAMPPDELANIESIDFVFDGDGNRLMPTPFPGLLSVLRGKSEETGD